MNALSNAIAAMCGKIKLLEAERNHLIEENGLLEGTLDSLNRNIEVFRLQHEKLRKALERIASYGEGPEVNSSFDEPHSAEIARQALGAQS